MKLLTDFLDTWYRKISKQHPPVFPVVLVLLAILCLVISHDKVLFSHIRSAISIPKELKPLRLHDIYIFIVMFIIPFIFLLVTKRNLKEFGLSFGNYRLALPVFFILLVGLTIVDYFISRMGSFQKFYYLSNYPFSEWLLIFCSHFLSMWAWEFMCRGFLLFGLKPYIGKLSIFIQLIPFVILHLGKPPLELYGSIFFGLIFGYYAYEVNSFLYCAILHAYFATMGEAFISLSPLPNL